MTHATPLSATSPHDEITDLHNRLSGLRRDIVRDADLLMSDWRLALQDGNYLRSAENLAHYLALQVLETLVKEGAATRAETTDAAMSQRAECVMLNKGPHLAEAVGFLDGVLRRMDRHQMKKSPRLAALGSWHGPQYLQVEQDRPAEENAA